jgi:hypothetical protein
MPIINCDSTIQVPLPRCRIRFACRVITRFVNYARRDAKARAAQKSDANAYRIIERVSIDDFDLSHLFVYIEADLRRWYSGRAEERKTRGSI